MVGIRSSTSEALAIRTASVPSPSSYQRRRRPGALTSVHSLKGRNPRWAKTSADWPMTTQARPEDRVREPPDRVEQGAEIELHRRRPADAGSIPSPCGSARTPGAGSPRCCAGSSCRSGGRPRPHRPARSPRAPAQFATRPERGACGTGPRPSSCSTIQPIVAARRTAGTSGWLSCPGCGTNRRHRIRRLRHDHGVRRPLRRLHPARQDQRAQRRLSRGSAREAPGRNRHEHLRSRWRCSASSRCSAPPWAAVISSNTPQRSEFEGVDTSAVLMCDDVGTATAFITTDRDGNQITAFYPGAMTRAAGVDLSALSDISEVVVGADDAGAMALHVEQAGALGARLIFAPAQQIPAMRDDDAPPRTRKGVACRGQRLRVRDDSRANRPVDRRRSARRAWSRSPAGRPAARLHSPDGVSVIPAAPVERGGRSHRRR